LLLKLRQNRIDPTAGLIDAEAAIGMGCPLVSVPAGRQGPLGVVESVHGQPQLFEIVAALGAPRRFTCRLDGGKQQGDQNADDGDDNQQLDQRKCALPCPESHIDLPN
jgi:hypothetical protein